MFGMTDIIVQMMQEQIQVVHYSKMRTCNEGDASFLLCEYKFFGQGFIYKQPLRKEVVEVSGVTSIHIEHRVFSFVIISIWIVEVKLERSGRRVTEIIQHADPFFKQTCDPVRGQAFIWIDRRLTKCMNLSTEKCVFDDIAIGRHVMA